MCYVPALSVVHDVYNYVFIHEGRLECRMAEEKKRFEEFKLHRVSEGKKLPQGDGVLIFDEVKVICRLMWNSRSQKIIGFAMTQDDLASLQDIYQLINNDSRTQQTSYIMQFLWRDLTSPFDVVGPYFTSGEAMESKFVVSCLLETLKSFHLHGFCTSLLVCDAASTNVATIKATCGMTGALGQNKDLPDTHMISPYFQNPFNPTRKIFWVICPSHQVCCYHYNCESV